MSRWTVLIALVGCAGEAPHDITDTGVDMNALTSGQKVPRYATIRDSARARGINNAYLLAGIANDETGLAMCWSEATWACQGPASPDCGGGPVIAGAADGPCSAHQGGLGMFQFDAGTYQDTLNTYGADVVTVDGQVRHAIDYVVHMVKISAYTTNAETDDKARAWVNNFDPNNPTLRDQWIKTVVRYYNGCQPGWSCWAGRYQSYSNGLNLAINEPGGLGFWAAPPPPPPPPPAPPVEGGPAFVVPNQQHVLARLSDGTLRHSFWDGGANQVFHDSWGSGVAGTPVTFVDGAQQHAFARTAAGAVGHWFWDPNANQVLHDEWGTGITSDVAAALVDGQQHVWATDAANNLQHWFWDPGANQVFHDTWGGGVTGRPTFMQVAAQQHVFVRGTNGTVEHFFWDPGANAVLHDTWGSGLAGDPAAALIGAQQHVWGVDAAGNLQHWFWDPNGGVAHDTWGAGVTGRPTVMIVPGQQHVFVRGAGGSLEHFFWDDNAGALYHDTWGTGIAHDPTALQIGAQQHVWALDAADNLQHWFWDPGANAVLHDTWGK